MAQGEVPPVFITEMNILARKGKLSVSVKMESLPDVSNEAKLRWLSRTVEWLEQNGFEEKDAPRNFGGGSGKTKTERRYWNKSTGETVLCDCGGKMYFTPKGATCENWSTNRARKHLFKPIAEFEGDK